MPRLPGRAGWGLVLLATALSVAWAGTSVLAVFTATKTVGANTFTTPASFCASPGVRPTLYASADSYIQQASANTNFGSSSSLFVNPTSGAAMRSLILFTLPTLPANCTVTAATLQLHNSSVGSGRSIDVYQANASWTENGVTWNNRPGQTGTAVTSTPATTQTWDVTAHVQAQYAGTNNGFVVRDHSEGSGTNQQNYDSRTKSGGSPPQLIVTWG